MRSDEHDESLTMTRAEQLIDQMCEIKMFHPDSVWQKKAGQLGGKKVGLEGRWLSYEFKDTRSAGKAANLAADLGLSNQWQAEIVQIKLP